MVKSLKNGLEKLQSKYPNKEATIIPNIYASTIYPFAEAYLMP